MRCRGREGSEWFDRSQYMSSSGDSCLRATGRQAICPEKDWRKTGDRGYLLVSTHLYIFQVPYHYLTHVLCYISSGYSVHICYLIRHVLKYSQCVCGFSLVHCAQVRHMVRVTHTWQLRAVLLIGPWESTKGITQTSHEARNPKLLDQSLRGEY